jgi:hypothetical protein
MNNGKEVKEALKMRNGKEKGRNPTKELERKIEW